jgi:DNA-binding transcriptional LysR family regulator
VEGIQSVLLQIGSAFSQNACMLNWDDFRFALAVTRMGSALGAARTLGVNQTTVVRRIAHMEEVLGGVLFERKQSGLRLTPFGQRVATAAARVESEILALCMPNNVCFQARYALRAVRRWPTSW